MKTRLAVAFLSGLIFAFGLGVSGMTHPSKVIGFLDFAGAWDPSLAFVMLGGVAVNFVAFRLVRRRGAPLLDRRFWLPTQSRVDATLVGGAALFGVGWGLGGLCPAPALVSAVTGVSPVVAFVVTMLGTMALFDALRGHRLVGAHVEADA